MKRSSLPSRRRFFTRIAFFTATVLFGRPLRADMTRTLARNVRDSFRYPRDAAVVGSQWLQTGSAGTDIASILQLLVSDRSAWQTALQSPSEIRKLAKLTIQSDFLHGLTVDLEGWILSLTEVRLCALAALSESRSGNSQADTAVSRKWDGRHG